MIYPQVRMRRLRNNKKVRDLVANPLPSASQFVYPIFLVEGKQKQEEIPSMPNQFRYSVDMLPPLIESLLKQNITSILLFGITEKKDATGSYSLNMEGPVQRGIVFIKKKYPEMNLIGDVCLCEYTDHGHCGPIAADTVANDISNDLYSKIACSYAQCGIDMVAPSGMMDGMVKTIRHGLDKEGFNDTPIMSYSSKFCSALYSPFRDAINSNFKGTRDAYQCNYRDPDGGIRESILDKEEAADILMVKPAMFYLDILHRVKTITNMPMAAFSVSGEYAMLNATAAAGFGSLEDLVRESTFAISRAGADIIITYWAKEYTRFFT